MRASPSRRVSVTNPGANLCTAPKSRTAAQTLSERASIGKSLVMEAIGRSFFKLSFRGASKASEPGTSRFPDAQLRIWGLVLTHHPGMTLLALRTHRLDIVAVGIDQKRGEIGRAVIGPRPGRAIVAAAGLRAGIVKLPDRGVIGTAERNVGAGDRPLVPIEP